MRMKFRNLICQDKGSDLIRIALYIGGITTEMHDWTQGQIKFIYVHNADWTIEPLKNV